MEPTVVRHKCPCPKVDVLDCRFRSPSHCLILLKTTSFFCLQHNSSKCPGNEGSPPPPPPWRCHIHTQFQLPCNLSKLLSRWHSSASTQVLFWVVSVCESSFHNQAVKPLFEVGNLVITGCYGWIPKIPHIWPHTVLVTSTSFSSA